MRCNLLLPKFLTDQHLIAERRELRMIPPLLEKRARTRSPVISGIPERYCLGEGHQKFWLDKFLYLEKRYISLTDEMLQRGFHPNLEFTLDVTCAKFYGLYNDWTPEPDDYDVIVARIIEKIEMKPYWYKYYSKPITSNWVQITYPLPYLK
jgi:deoxyribonuclease (pyrimidine dimer)